MNRYGRSDAVIAGLLSELTGDYDRGGMVQDICDQAVRCLDVVQAVLLMQDGDGTLTVLAVSADGPAGPRSHELHVSGAGAESAHRGAVTMADDVRVDQGRWPDAAALMTQIGLVGTRGFPLRLMGRPIGSLTLFSAEAWGAERGSSIGQSFADLAVLALAQVSDGGDRWQAVAHTVAELVRVRTVVFQAEGMLAEAGGSTIDAAVARLRGYARQQRRPVAVIAAQIVEGTLELAALIDAA